MMMRQILIAVFFLSSMILGQERPTFALTRLTKEGIITQQYWGDELLVKFRAGFRPEFASAKSGIRQASATTFRRLAAEPQMESYYILPYSGSIEALQRLQQSLATADPAVEWVSFSPVFHAFQGTQPTYGPVPQQWALGSSFPGSINWDRVPRLKADHVYLVVADTGGCFGHEDFDWSRNFWNYNAISAISPNLPDLPATDDNGHSCAVASVAVARVNGKGIDGVADFLKFGFVKVLNNKGEGDTKDIVNGLLVVAWMARELKRRDPSSRIILNLSFGAPEYVPPISEAVQIVRQAGAIVVAAAGNSGLNIDRVHVSPASVPGVIAVGASDWENGVAMEGSWAINWGNKVGTTQKSWASNYGRRSVLLVAPGKNIDVAVPRGEGLLLQEMLFDSSGYRRLDGTSFAAPHVAGAIALMLAKFPDLTEEQIRVRLMNGNRQMKPWQLNLRNYDATELFKSGARLDLSHLLDEDKVSPPQPYLVPTEVGHSSAKIRLAGTEKPFGIRCFSAEKETYVAVPFFGTTNSDGGEILLRGPGNAPLPENTVHQLSCAVVDAAGNWSAPSEPVEFRTTESRSAQVELVFSVQPGPIASEVIRLKGDNPSLWHLAEFQIFDGPAWYAGTDAFNYHIGVSDSQLVSQEIDLRNVTGSISLRIHHFLQMLGYGIQGTHYDAAEIRVKLLGDDGRLGDKIIAENIPNARGFGLEELSLDLTEYAGQHMLLSFRFFTNGSSLGIGWIISDVQLRTDR